MNSLISLGERAKEAARATALATTEQKNEALRAMAKALKANADRIIAANETDLENGRSAGLSKALLDRLSLNRDRVFAMADGVEALISLADPVGRVLDSYSRPNGIKLTKISVPFGVIGIIYEARPNVTSDAAAIALKAGSAVILRGGKEAINSNLETARIMREAVKSAGLPEDSIQLVTDTSRQSATDLMTLSGYVDVLIPRGGAGLIR